MLRQHYKVLVGGSLVAVTILSGAGFVLQTRDASARAQPASADTSEDAVWFSDPEAALTRAAANERPLVIMFYARWCGICEHMKQTTLAEEQVIQELGELVPLIVDIEVHSSFVNRFDVLGLPTTVIATSQGESIHTRSGYVDRDAYLALLDRAVE